MNKQEVLRFAGLAAVGAVLGIAVALPFVRWAPPGQTSISASPARPPALHKTDLEWVSLAVRGLAKTQGPEGMQRRGRVWVKIFRQGALVATHWSRGQDSWENGVREIGPAPQAADFAEVGLCDEERERPWKGVAPELARGHLGLHLGEDLLAPTDFIYGGKTASPTPRPLTFHAHTALVGLHEQGAWWLAGARPLVDPSEITQASVTRMYETVGANLLKLSTLHHNRIPAVLSYAPLEMKDEELLVRHCLGIWGLAVWVRDHPTSDNQSILRDNLQAAVKLLVRHEGPRAYVQIDRDDSLGGLALLAMALSVQGGPAGTEEELAQTLLSMQTADGHFRTYFHDRSKPPEQDINQNFYPGEAMVYLAHRAARSPASLQAFQKGIVYYQKHFRAHPHPAFVPWFALACATAPDPDHRLRDFVFEMEDWNLTTQSEWWKNCPPELQGAFAGKHPHRNTLLHASGTAAQLQGLVEALRLAREAHDEPRTQRYRSALLGCLRYLRQLQLDGDRDLYFVGGDARSALQGCIVDTLGPLHVRVDNAGHTLEALSKVTRQLGAGDYAH